MSGLIEELKRRNVFKVGTAYVVLSWLLAQAADLAAETFEAPGWVMKMLVTLLVLGLPLVLFFSWAYELTPEGLKKEKDVDRSQSITPTTGRKLDFMVIGFLVLALGYFVWESRFASDDAETNIVVAEQTAEEQGEAPAAITEDITLKPSSKSIAVLPFVNMSDDASNEYFSDGISEEILNALARVRDLKVAGRTSSFAFKGQNQDLRVIGETLGVSNILEGSVRKEGDTVRITAQLIQVEDGFHLWSDSYDRELTNVFAIQDEIASAILTELKAHLLDGELVPVTVERTSSEAYDLYLLARQRIYERKQLSIESAAELLDKAIELDPTYAPAYAQRGIAELLLSENTYGATPENKAQTQAKLYLEKSLDLDPGLAEGLAGMGLYWMGETGQHNQAIEVLEKAVEINPNLISALNWLQNSYANAGRLSDAIDTLEDMIQKDPLYPPAIGNGMNYYIAVGQYDKAKAYLERVRPYLPGDPIITRADAQIHFAHGEYALGIPFIEAALAQQPDHAVFRNGLGEALMSTLQNERAAKEGPDWIKVFANLRLGRAEEAGIIAEQRAAEGDVETFFAYLNVMGRHQDVITYLEDRWPDLDSYEETFPADDVDGHGGMAEVAFAYKQLDNQPRFNEAMEKIRRVQDMQKSLGADTRVFYVFEAVFYAMAGDLERAIEEFEVAVEKGFASNPRITDEWPSLEPLNGDPRFEQARTRMLENINRERIDLGLEPVSA